MEQSHQRDDLAFELGILELTRDDATHRDVAGGGNGELQNQLALELRVVAQRTRVQAVDATLVAIEDGLDLFARACWLAPAAAGGRATAVEFGTHDARGNSRGVVAGKRACAAAEAATRVGGGDTAAAD